MLCLQRSVPLSRRASVCARSPPAACSRSQPFSALLGPNDHHRASRMLVPALVSLLSLPGYVLSYDAAHNASSRVSLNTQSYELSVRRLCRIKYWGSTLTVVLRSHSLSTQGLVCVHVVVLYCKNSIPAAERCPPCFNCQLPRFSCGHFGECSHYDGQCKCPPGWAGIDCLTPRTSLGSSLVTLN